MEGFFLPVKCDAKEEVMSRHGFLATYHCWIIHSGVMTSRSDVTIVGLIVLRTKVERRRRQDDDERVIEGLC